MLPTIDFFGTQVTRMIIGDNPFNGHSYIEDIVTGEQMKEFYTPDRILKTLCAIQEQGYNTILPLACPSNIEILHKFRQMGGKLNIIFQPYPAIPLKENIKDMISCQPIGIYHQGTTTDYLMETGDLKTLRSNIELIRETGLPTGLCSHVPETIMLAEKEKWGIDFYMACLYNARRNRLGEPSGFITGKTKSQLVFCPDDRFAMFEVINEVKKPFIAYKILAGGQVYIGKASDEYDKVTRDVFEETYKNIKPGDIACVGVFQRDFNQLAVNSRLVAEVL
jgi:hypothetical protein